MKRLDFIKIKISRKKYNGLRKKNENGKWKINGVRTSSKTFSFNFF
jgi:hypothetical protein